RPPDVEPMPVPDAQPFSRVILPAAAAILGAALHAVEPVAGFAAGGVLLVIGAVFALRRRPQVEQLPLPPAPLDSLSATSARLRLLESAVVHAHDAVVIIEAQPRSGPGRAVLYVNDAFCRMTGYTPEEVVGRSLHFLRGPGSDLKTLKVIRDALAAG